MKTIMTIAMALFVTVVAQAGSINWAITGAAPIKTAANANVGAGWTVYLVLTDSLADIDTAIKDGTFTSTTTGVLGSALTGTGSNVSTTQTATSASLTAYSSYNFTVLYFNTTDYVNTLGTTSSYRTTSTVNQLAYADDPQYQVTWSSAAPGIGGSWNAYTVIPEPTAMALLALGAAAVGLRRRFRT